MTLVPSGLPPSAIARAAEAVAILVAMDDDGLVAALEPLDRLIGSTSAEIAVLVMAQLCAGVTLGCADLLEVDPVRLVLDTAAAMHEPGPR